MENDRLGTGITNLFINFFYKDKSDENTKYTVQTGAIIYMLSVICLKGLIMLFKRNVKDFLEIVNDL